MEALSLQWYIAQAIGFFALLLGVSAFLQKSDLAFKRGMTIFCLVEAIHFFLLTAYSASFGCFVNGTRSFASSKTRSKAVMTFFLVFLWSVGCLSIASFDMTLIQQTYAEGGTSGLVHLFFFDQPIKLFPLLGSTIGTIGLFLLSGIKLRIAVFICSFLWFVHNVAAISIGPSIMEAVFMMINARTIYGLWKKSKQNA